MAINKPQLQYIESAMINRWCDRIVAADGGSDT